LAAAAAIQILLADYLPYYPEALRRKIAVIGHPSPPPREVDFAERAQKTTRTLLGVGRFLDADKRFSLLLRAFASLAKEFPAWQLKLVGDGPYWDKYHIMAEQLGIADRVLFTGAVADVGAHYADADVFCLPSAAEGFGIVYEEAAAWALPLAGFASCTASAALIAPGAGALAEKDSPESLAHALRSLMAAAPEERARAGKAARDFFQTHYDEGAVFDAWETLLTQAARKTDRRWEREMNNTAHLRISPEWNGLEPDGGVWTEALLQDAAAEIAGRAVPTVVPETSSAPADAENVRLRCELARLKQDFAVMEKKYASLLTQFQALAVKRKKR
jgi:hypothetical protein